MKEIHKVIPDSVPRPIGWGTYEEAKDLHFFLCEFLSLVDEQYPDMKEFTEVLAELHVKSEDFSPNGQYGFQVTTNNGPTPQYTKWTDSWEEVLI